MKLGEHPEENVGHRDAAHVPFVVTTSTDNLSPGDSVRFENGDCVFCEASSRDERHGIVDPFVPYVANKFVVLIDPKYVKAVTHKFEIDTGAIDEEIDPDGIGCGRTCG